MDRLNQALRRVPPWTIYVAAVAMFGWLVVQVATGALGPDPVKGVEQRLGLLALQFLVASLCVTPLRWVGLNLIRYRRALGLAAFGFAALHLAAWVLLDMGLRWSEITADLYKRPYIIVGMVGLLAMLPLAATSSNAAVRRMGPAAWARLHRMAYVAGIAAAVHFVMVGKVWERESLIYAGAVVVLLGARAFRLGMPRRSQPARQG